MRTVRARASSGRREPDATDVPYRATVDFRRLFAEGARFAVQGHDVSMLTEPFDDARAVIVVAVLVPKDKVEVVKSYGMSVLDLWQRYGAMLGPLLATMGAAR